MTRINTLTSILTALHLSLYKRPRLMGGLQECENVYGVLEGSTALILNGHVAYGLANDAVSHQGDWNPQLRC